MYRKFQANSIFTGSTILPRAAVLITDEYGTVLEITDEAQAGDNIERFNGIISPGFVNAHCHLELSHLKGKIAAGMGLVDFVQKVMGERDGYTAEEKLVAMAAAEAELWCSGTVAVGDICNTADSLPIKQNSQLYWHNFIEVSGFVSGAAEARLKHAEEILASFNKVHAKSRSSVAAHAPYSVSAALFRLLNERTAGQLTSIHNQEAIAENELYQSKTGLFLNLYKNLGIDITTFRPTAKSSIQSWLPYFNRDQRILAVHNTFTDQQDIAFVSAHSQASVHFCICVNANLYIEKALPPLDILAAGNSALVIGTDSYASNMQLNMMAEINSIRKFFPQIPLEKILSWATKNGADALGISDQFGSFEKGKQPGLVLIDGTFQSTRLL